MTGDSYQRKLNLKVDLKAVLKKNILIYMQVLKEMTNIARIVYKRQKLLKHWCHSSQRCECPDTQV